MNIPLSIVHISGLLKENELLKLDELLGNMAFVDGKATASGAAKEVKSNLQTPAADIYLQQAEQIIIQAISSCPLLHATVFPKMILPITISKYQLGMQYGWHTDSPLMSNRATIRVDLSMTIFLSDPASYEGGELVIHSASGFTPIKLAKGDAIVYPTTRLHCVNPVTSGERIAAVTWMQSMIRSTEQRELLYQLKTVQEQIGAQPAQSSENLVLQQVYSNLVRMWADV